MREGDNKYGLCPIRHEMLARKPEETKTMIGAIAGDIIGSIYESRPIKTTDFPLFHPHCRPTDDTVLTVALADSILNGTAYVRCLKDYFERYPHVGYGPTFGRWA